MDELRLKIESLIESGVEGDYWDFKQEWHAETEKLIHDILCFANTVHHNDCYIIFGISNIGEYVSLEDSKRRKQSDIIDCLYNIHFAGDNVPQISVETFDVDNRILDILIIHNSLKTPFYIKGTNKNHHKLVAGYIYTRNKDRNTPINQNASVEQIEMLWKKRFNLTQPVLKQIYNLIEHKHLWQQYEDSYYYIYNSDFVIVEETDYDLKGKEFYVHTQYNPNVMYQNIRIMNRMTVLEEYQAVLLDSAVYKTPVPEWEFIHYTYPSRKADISYKYYLKDSLRYKLQLFYEDLTSYEACYSKKRYDRVIVYFSNEKERTDFEKYILQNFEMYKEYYETLDKEDEFYIDEENANAETAYKKELNDGLVLNKMLYEFRVNINNMK